AGPNPSRICASVKDNVLPGSLCGVGSGAGAAAGAAGAAGGAAAGPGGVAKPYAHGGGTVDDCCWAARTPAAITKAKARVKTTNFLITLLRLSCPRRSVKADGSHANHLPSSWHIYSNISP